MNRGGVLIEALLVTLASPATWPLALGAFLVRGGILLVALPIVVVPTPVGIGTAIGPVLSSVAFGTIPPEFVMIVGAIGVGMFAWLVAGGWLAAALEAEGARLVAGDEEVAASSRDRLTLGAPGALADEHWAGADEEPERAAYDERKRAADDGRGSDLWGARPVAGRILIARFVAYLPLAVVLALGSVRLVFVTYRELTQPIDVGTPIMLRVLRASSEVVVAAVVAWMTAEIIGAMAARRIVLADVGVGAAVREAASRSVRHPGSALVRFWLPTIVLALVLVPGTLAAASAWEAVGAVLGTASDPLRILVTVVAFVGLWIVGLLLISVVCAWRAAVWTVAEVTREGTFGGSADRRPGHWRPGGSSARL